jgi:hypothetical protein
MRTYVITQQNTASVYEREPTTEGTMVRSYDDLLSWPSQRLVDVWNKLSTNAPVRKFENRTKGAQRVWRALEQLTPIDEPRSKKQAVYELLQRPSGASLEELMSATGWQPHSVRGFISTHKKEYDIERFQRDERQYAYRAKK